MNSIFPLRNGSALMLTTARYYTPSGHTFEATGIEPDVEVAEEGDTDRPLDIARSASKKLKNADLSSKEVAIQLLKAKVEEAKDGGKPK